PVAHHHRPGRAGDVLLAQQGRGGPAPRAGGGLPASAAGRAEVPGGAGGRVRCAEAAVPGDPRGAAEEVTACWTALTRSRGTDGRKKVRTCAPLRAQVLRRPLTGLWLSVGLIAEPGGWLSRQSRSSVWRGSLEGRVRADGRSLPGPAVRPVCGRAKGPAGRSRGALPFVSTGVRAAPVPGSGAGG